METLEKFREEQHKANRKYVEEMADFCRSTSSGMMGYDFSDGTSIKVFKMADGTFYMSYTDEDGTFESRSWDFGDGAEWFMDKFMTVVTDMKWKEVERRY